jgi:DNA-binding HxlR family transcriptional regulator
MLSFQRRESRAAPLEMEFELTKALARVLSACAKERTIGDLQRSLMIEQASLARFVGFLDMNGFLERGEFHGEQTFRSTEMGARLLDAFVTLYRAVGGGLPSDETPRSARSQYAPCNYCGNHALYPSTPPMTLHVGAECQLCHHSGR